MSTVLEINNLSKNYGTIKALNGLNVNVQKGMVFGILGPNGSGKTTTLGILLGVLNQTSGAFSWFGNGNDDRNRMRIGSLLETPNFFPYLDAVKNLKIVGQIKDLENVDERIEKVLKAVNLYDRKGSKFKTYSLGMKQRLAIAAALLSDPEVLVLDEPTNGLDPQGIAEIRNLILEISKEGKTILIASHQLDEIEKVCTDVVILKKGVVIAHGDVDSITGGTQQVYVGSSDKQGLKAVIDKLDGASISNEDPNGFLLNVSDELNAQQINQFCFENNIVLTELKGVKKSLETSFLEITKE